MRTRLSTEQRREQLLAIGARLFAQRPYDEVAIEDVAQIAQISRGLLYHYFANKREFFLAIIDAESRRLLEASAPEPSLSPLDRLRAGLDVYLTFARRHPDGFRVVERSATTDQEVRRIREARLAVQRDRILSALADLIPVGDVDRIAITGWFAFVTAAILDWLDDPTVSRDEMRELCARTLFAAVGLQPGHPHG